MNDFISYWINFEVYCLKGSQSNLIRIQVMWSERYKESRDEKQVSLQEGWQNLLNQEIFRSDEVVWYDWKRNDSYCKYDYWMKIRSQI
jgi:hypothetical protein